MRKKSLVMQTQIGVKISTLNFSRHTCKREWDIAESGNKLMKMMSKLKKKSLPYCCIRSTQTWLPKISAPTVQWSGEVAAGISVSVDMESVRTMSRLFMTV